jgi:hypothetical protein
VELVEVDVQVGDGLVGERHDAGLIAPAGEQDAPRLGQANIARCQASDLADVGRGVVEQDQQHPVAAGFRCLPGECGEDHTCLSFGEVLDGPARSRWRLSPLADWLSATNVRSSSAA